jgi:hypothetical protein
MVCAKVSIYNNNKSNNLILISAYRPTNINTDYSERLASEIESITSKNKKSVVWIGGDFNLPDIDWKTCAIQSNRYLVKINERFIEMLNNCGMEQVVDEPTREKNVLDLFFTNRPSLIAKASILPGISDHEIVSVGSYVTAPRTKPCKRKIYLWKKANTIEMKSECINIRNELLARFNKESSVEKMWLALKTKLLELQEKFVPHKFSLGSINRGLIPKPEKTPNAIHYISP